MKMRYIALITAGVVLVLVSTFFIQATTVYSSQVIAKEAGGAIGIAPFTDRIDFGDVPQGAEVAKTLIMVNNGTVPNQITIFIIGGIADLVKIQPSSVTLEPGDEIEVQFRLKMPASVPPEKKYSGRVIVLRLPKRFF